MSLATFPGQTAALVTGATGFVATELIKQLLERGYAVRGTVRDPSATHKTKELVELADALPGSIEFVRASLLEEGSFDEAVKGVDVVFHVASPCVLTADDPEREIVRPALAGTENVLRAVAKADPRPRRVVVTSSLVAVIDDFTNMRPGHVYGPDDWNAKSTLETAPYELSKTLAERRAWELAKELGLDVVTVNPSLVLGPIVARDSGSNSRSMFSKLLTDKTFMLNKVHFVDVRDVALAHIRAAETLEAKGRYIVSREAATPLARIFSWLGEAYPDGGFPFEEVAEEPRSIDVSKARDELGVAFRPVRETVLDMARTLLAYGLVSLE